MGQRRAGEQRAGLRRLGQLPGVLALGISTGGNTLGTSGTKQGSIVLAGIGGITLSQATNINGATISVSAATESGVAIAQGTETDSVGVVVFSQLALNSTNGPVVSFGLSASTMTARALGAVALLRISAGTLDTTYRATAPVGLSNSLQVFWGGNVSHSAFDVDTPRLSVQAVALAGGTQTATIGTVALANSNGFTFGLSLSSQLTVSMDAVRIVALTDSAGVTSVQQGSALSFGNPGGGVSFGLSTSGANSSILTAGPLQVRYFENWRAADLLAQDVSIRLGSLLVQRVALPQLRISATQLDCYVNVSNSSSAGATLTFRWGIYTMSGSTASMASSGSRTGAYNSTLAGSSYTDLSNWRVWSVPVSWNVTPGDYLVAFNLDSASALTNGTYSMYGGRNSTMLGEPYLNQNYSKYFDLGVVNTNGIPASIHLSAISQTAASNVAAPVFPWFKLIGTF